MSGIRVVHKGNFTNTLRFLKRDPDVKIRAIMHKHGSLGISELRRATPRDTSEAANSWSFDIKKTKTGWSLDFYNSDMAGSVPVVILLQYGHGTRGGTYVQGRDFINPAIGPIFDKLLVDIWKEVADVKY